MNGQTNIKNLTGLLARLIVGGVFVYSGAIKALAPAEEFAYAIESYKVIGPGLSLLAAHAVPWIELYTGLLLACGIFTRSSVFFTAAMLAFFELMLGQAWLRDLPITSCGCFGSAGSNSITEEFLQNLALLALLWPAASYRRLSADGSEGQYSSSLLPLSGDETVRTDD
ncbi:MAG: DoxX family protein [Elusimicrobia bacterium CG08_land_8_20_14_0_20_59_10]|nr:MAG: DoxX family protein [Elusimicrobia bacterium CG08_land_8_20_14_0_20_59_10]